MCIELSMIDQRDKITISQIPDSDDICAGLPQCT